MLGASRKENLSNGIGHFLFTQQEITPAPTDTDLSRNKSFNVKSNVVFGDDGHSTLSNTTISKKRVPQNPQAQLATQSATHVFPCLLEEAELKQAAGESISASRKKAAPKRSTSSFEMIFGTPDTTPAQAQHIMVNPLVPDGTREIKQSTGRKLMHSTSSSQIFPQESTLTPAVPHRAKKPSTLGSKMLESSIDFSGQTLVTQSPRKQSSHHKSQVVFGPDDVNTPPIGKITTWQPSKGCVQPQKSSKMTDYA